MIKKTLAILGVGVAVGAVVYALWHRSHKEDKAAEGGCEGKSNDYHFEDSVSVVIDKATVGDDVDAVKSAGASDMAARHEETSQIMKDAVDIIYKRSEVAEDENKELEQISNELDDLLRED